MKRIVVQRAIHREEKLDPKVYLDYDEEMAKVNEGHDVVPVEGQHPFYILYTSGTTGAPKGIYRSQGSTLVGLSYAMNKIFDIQKDETVLTYSDIGWIVGHHFIVYGPLLQGATTIVFEGKPVGTPDAGVLWRLIDEYKANTFYIAPTAIRAIKKEDIHGDFIKK